MNLVDMIKQLHVGLSYKCNLDCKHCFVNKKEGILELNKVKRFIDILEKNGLLMVYHTYGEPLMNDDFFEFAEYLKYKKIYQILLTNGWFINDEIVQLIKNVGINRVMVSLDSAYSSKHDENRGKKGSYEKSLNALKLLNKYNIKSGISFTCTNKNINEIYEIVKIAEEEKVCYISFLAERNNCKINLELHDEYIDLFRKAVKNDLNYFFHDIRLNNHLETLMRKGLINYTVYNKFKLTNRCQIMENLSLAPNGDLYKCNFISKEAIANLNSFEDMELLYSKIENFKIRCCIDDEN